MLGLTAKKPSPVIARSSDDSDWTRLPWLNCWRIDFTTVPEPIILVGLTDTLDAMTSANSVSERLKPLVETFARLCEIVDISDCEALRPLSEVRSEEQTYELQTLMRVQDGVICW